MTDIREATVRANDLEFAYLEAGEGPAVFLLHGFPDNAWGWQPQIEALAAAGYRAIAPFIRGFPPTEVPGDGKVDPLTLGRDLLALIDALADGRAKVVGHDFGALMTQSAIAQDPSRVERAAILAVPHPATAPQIALNPKLAQHSFHLWMFTLPTIAQAAIANDDYALIEHIWDYWSDDATDIRPHVERVKKTLSAPGALDNVNAYYRGLVGTPEAPGLPPEIVVPFQVPTMVIYGADDPIPAHSAADEEQHYAAGYRRVDIPNARHNVQQDAPERVSELLLEWFGEAGGSPAPVEGSVAADRA